jgi:hypothetical protein
MNKELLTATPFGGEQKAGFKVEAASGSAKLQFLKSTGSYVDLPGGLYTTDDLIRLDMFSDQMYQWVLTGGAKVFKEF